MSKRLLAISMIAFSLLPLLAALWPTVAAAQTPDPETVSTTQVVIGPFLEWALTILSAATTAAIAALVPYFIRRFFNLEKEGEQVLAQMITSAASRGAGLAYNHLLTSAISAPPIELKNRAVAIGLNYVLEAFPNYSKQNGLTPEKISKMVEGELGKLLAVDPNVQVGEVMNRPSE